MTVSSCNSELVSIYKDVKKYNLTKKELGFDIDDLVERQKKVKKLEKIVIAKRMYESIQISMEDLTTYEITAEQFNRISNRIEELKKIIDVNKLSSKELSFSLNELNTIYDCLEDLLSGKIEYKLEEFTSLYNFDPSENIFIENDLEKYKKDLSSQKYYY